MITKTLTIILLLLILAIPVTTAITKSNNNKLDAMERALALSTAIIDLQPTYRYREDDNYVKVTQSNDPLGAKVVSLSSQFIATHRPALYNRINTQYMHQEEHRYDVSNHVRESEQPPCSLPETAAEPLITALTTILQPLLLPVNTYSQLTATVYNNINTPQ